MDKFYWLVWGVQMLKKVPPELFKLPPDVDDELALRKYITAAFSFAGVLADETEMTIDDDAVAVVANLVEDDAIWAVLYRVLHQLLCNEEHDDDNKVGDRRYKVGDELIGAGAVGIDPVTLITIAKIIFDVIKWWRQR